jgi:hypothetical protein
MIFSFYDTYPAHSTLLFSTKENHKRRFWWQSTHWNRGCPISYTVYCRVQNHIQFRSQGKQVVLKPLLWYIRFRPRLLLMFASPSTAPIPMAALSKVWVCRRSLAGIAASNPARGMDISRQEESYRVRGV